MYKTRKFYFLRLLYYTQIKFTIRIFHDKLLVLEGYMHEYVFKMKKGDIEIELKSDDLEFVEEQLNKWREELLQQD